MLHRKASEFAPMYNFKKMKMMKNIIYIAITVFFVSCTNDFEEINTNPNSPTEVQSSLLLRQVIYDFGEQMSYEGFVAGDLLGQHRTAVDFNLFDRHALKSPQLGGNPWPIIYTNLRDNEILLQRATSIETDRVYEGPARVLKAYMGSMLTDLFGDVPYFSAFQGQNGIVTPEYDSQEEIYLSENGIISELDKSIEVMGSYEGAISLEGDLLYNGDLQGWILFANSIKLRCLLRLSDRIDVSGQVEEIYNSGFYISQNEENAVFDFTASQPNNFRMARLRIGDFTNFVMSKTMEEIITQYNDPRAEVFFQTIETDEYSGLLNGIDASQTSIEISDYSLSGTIYREQSELLDANFMTAWETHFLLSEAASKGMLSADSRSLYESGVQLAFDYWHTELPADYLTDVADFDNPDKSPLEQIITQKWLANTFQDYQAWIEWKRTGFPNLKPVSASLNNDIIPVRMPYPAEEAALNADNYIEAAQETNQNSINAPVWWDID